MTLLDPAKITQEGHSHRLTELQVLAEEVASLATKLVFNLKHQHDSLVLPGTAGAQAAEAMGDERTCPIFGAHFQTGSELRGHLGAHQLQGYPECGGSTTDTCGFCGGEITSNKCVTTVTNLGKSVTSKFKSNCLLFPERATYGPASKSKLSSPCSNMPIECTRSSGGTTWGRTTITRNRLPPTLAQ